MVRPAINIEILATLHHLLGRATLHSHIGDLDIARNLELFGIYDKDAVVPNLRDVGLLVGEEVDISGRGEICNSPHLLEGVDIDCKDHM